MEAPPRAGRPDDVGGGALQQRLTAAGALLARADRVQWGFACGLVDGVIYIVGGSTASGDAPTDRVSAYDIASNSGTDKAVFRAPKLGLAGATIGTKI